MNIQNQILNYLMNVVTLKNVAVFAVSYFLVIWVFLLIRVIRDITSRTDKVYLLVISILIIIIFNLFGFFLYLLIRPGKTLFEQYQKEVELNLESLSEEIIEKIGKKNLHIVKCEKCNNDISLEFKYCPYCKKKIDVLEFTKNSKIMKN